MEKKIETLGFLLKFIKDNLSTKNSQKVQNYRALQQDGLLSSTTPKIGDPYKKSKI